MKYKNPKRPTRVIGYLDKKFPILNKVSLLELEQGTRDYLCNEAKNNNADIMVLVTCPHRTIKKRLYPNAPIGFLSRVEDDNHRLEYEFNRQEIVDYADRNK